MFSCGLILAICFSVSDFVKIASGIQSEPSTQSEESALRALVESYYAAYGKKDLAGVLALWSEKSPPAGSVVSMLFGVRYLPIWTGCAGSE